MNDERITHNDESQHHELICLVWFNSSTSSL